jgi:hypothetical protein
LDGIIQSYYFTKCVVFYFNLITSSLMIYRPQPIFSGDKIEKNEMDGACSAHGGEESVLQGFGGET